jgi:hypothetical protein
VVVAEVLSEVVGAMPGAAEIMLEGGLWEVSGEGELLGARPGEDTLLGEAPGVGAGEAGVPSEEKGFSARQK